MDGVIGDLRRELKKLAGTPFPTLDSLFRAVIAVPKTEIDTREKEWRRAQKRKRTKKAL